MNQHFVVLTHQGFLDTSKQHFMIKRSCLILQQGFLQTLIQLSHWLVDPTFQLFGSRYWLTHSCNTIALTQWQLIIVRKWKQFWIQKQILELHEEKSSKVNWVHIMGFYHLNILWHANNVVQAILWWNAWRSTVYQQLGHVDHMTLIRCCWHQRYPIRDIRVK